MGRIRWFVAGLACGAGAMYASLSYHFLYTKEGLKAVPKQSATFAETFLDVREFGPSDWVEHPNVMAAVVKADEGKMLETATIDSLRNSAKGWLDEVRER